MGCRIVTGKLANKYDGGKLGIAVIVGSTLGVGPVSFLYGRLILAILSVVRCTLYRNYLEYRVCSSDTVSFPSHNLHSTAAQVVTRLQQTRCNDG